MAGRDFIEKKGILHEIDETGQNQEMKWTSPARISRAGLGSCYITSHCLNALRFLPEAEQVLDGLAFRRVRGDGRIAQSDHAGDDLSAQEIF